jgi:hypothetical protein
VRVWVRRRKIIKENVFLRVSISRRQIFISFYQIN